MALTETRGNKKPFTVKPLVIEAPERSPAASDPVLDWARKTIATFDAAASVEDIKIIAQKIAKNRGKAREARPDLAGEIDDAERWAFERTSPPATGFAPATAPASDDGWPGGDASDPAALIADMERKTEVLGA